MKKILTLITVLFLAVSTCYPQNLKQKKVDAEVAKCLKANDPLSASFLISKFSAQEISKGNLEIALQYQIKNCELFVQYLELFFENGFTLDDYFTYFALVWGTERMMGKTDEAIADFLYVVPAIKQYSPELLPKYYNTIIGAMANCQTKELTDSIYGVQDAMNVLKFQEVNEENVNYYISFSSFFYQNRFYKSVDNNIFVYDGFAEMKQWFNNNKDYIDKLDKELYKYKVLEYYVNYTDMLYLHASTIGAQLNQPQKAIEKYKEIITIIEPLLCLNDTLSQKIAGCYANISSSYSLIGNFPLAKYYSDLTKKYLYSSHKNDLDYCDILNSLSNTYFNINQPEKAATIRLGEIMLRLSLGMKPSSTDWAQLFLYMGDQNPEQVIDYHHRIKLENNDTRNEYYYVMVGHAFSLLSNKNSTFNDSTLYYFNKAEESINSNKSYYEQYNLLDGVYYRLYSCYSTHYLQKGNFAEATRYNNLAVDRSNKTYDKYTYSTILSAYLHDTTEMHTIWPIYFKGLENSLNDYISVLSSQESDQLMAYGNAHLFHIPEWVSWNPTDSTSLTIGYDAALLIKKLTLRFNNITSAIAQDAVTYKEKQNLDNLRDSIYTIENENELMLALHEYQVSESRILDKVKQENIHWHDVWNMLGENESCIEFVKYYTNTNPWESGEQKLHYATFILSKERTYPAFVDLFDEDELIDIYNLQPKSYTQGIGHNLYNAIWSKINPFITNSSTTYFSPTGTLNLIGIEFLTDSNGIAAVDNYNLRRVSSTAQIANAKHMQDINNIVAFGGIGYKKPTHTRNTLDSIISRGDWNYLENTSSEVSSISNSMSSRTNTIMVFTDKNASEEKFKQLDGTDANVIHIASHGFYLQPSKRSTENYYSKSIYTKRIQDELFYSGLVLSGGQESWNDSVYGINNNDGILTSYEISKLDLHNVNLVVLSACETGLGDNNYDGIYGLQLAFKKAGVKSILMSLWKVDDKVTAEYMSTFYELIAKGESIHEAYKKTVQQIKSKYPDPFYWAAFILLD